MGYQVEIKQVGPQPTVSIHTSVRAPERSTTLTEVLPQVWHYLRTRGIQPAGPPFVRYHDISAERMDIEAGMPVAEPIEGEGRIQAGELPEGEAAVTWHIGPYDTITEAFQAIEAWARDHGREVAGAPWEVYWTDPGQVPNPAEWKTEVLWPVR